MNTYSVQGLYDNLLTLANNAYRNSQDIKWQALSEHWLGKAEAYEMAAHQLAATAQIWGHTVVTTVSDRWLDIDNARREEAQSESFIEYQEVAND